MKKTFIIGVSILLIAFTSCKECPCAPGELRFDLIGFSEAEADTFIIRQYEANGSFNFRKDTFIIDLVRYRRFNDTLKLVAYPGTVVLQSRFDYEIFFPESNSLYRISEITEQMSTQRCGGGLFGSTKEYCMKQSNHLN